MKVVAVFDVDEEVLNEVEDGSIDSAFAWCSDSGLYLGNYQVVNDDYELPDIDAE